MQGAACAPSPTRTSTGRRRRRRAPGSTKNLKRMFSPRSKTMLDDRDEQHREREPEAPREIRRGFGRGPRRASPRPRAAAAASSSRPSRTRRARAGGPRSRGPRPCTGSRARGRATRLSARARRISRTGSERSFSRHTPAQASLVVEIGDVVVVVCARDLAGPGERSRVALEARARQQRAEGNRHRGGEAHLGLLAERAHAARAGERRRGDGAERQVLLEHVRSDEHATDGHDRQRRPARDPHQQERREQHRERRPLEDRAREEQEDERGARATGPSAGPAAKRARSRATGSRTR